MPIGKKFILLSFKGAGEKSCEQESSIIKATILVDDPTLILVRNIWEKVS